MKKNLLLLLIINIIVACSPKVIFYEGYIYNMKKKTISGLKVCVQDNNECTITNEKGFFKLPKQKNSIKNLIVFYNNEPIDTLKTVWSQHGEKIHYSFIEDKRDTLFIDIKN